MTLIFADGLPDYASTFFIHITNNSFDFKPGKKAMIIDKANGQLKISDNLSISCKTTPGDLQDYFRNDGLKSTDHHNGWVNYTISNVKLNNKYFSFTFYFESDILRIVQFILSDAMIITETWANWSEETELKKRDDYNAWLTEELGEERALLWGTIATHYDAKAGASNIILMYKR